MPDYEDTYDGPDVPDDHLPAPIAHTTTIDITQSGTHVELLPAAVYKSHCRPLRVSEITVEMIETFLDNLETTGQYDLSAQKVGLYGRLLKKIEKMDQRFAAMVSDRMAIYTGTVEVELHRRAVEGWDEPVFSHKTGGMIGTIRRHDARLLELLVKKLNPAYREKVDVSTSVNVGVMVVPMAPKNEADWIEMANQAAKPVQSTPVLPPAPPLDENAPPDLTGGQ